MKVPGEAPALNLPGSVAEANSNALPARTPALPEDPLIAAAEQTIREAAADQAPAPAPAAPPAPAPEPAPTPRPEAPTAATPPAEAESEVTMQVRLPVIPKSADTPGTATQDPYTGTEAPDPYAPETGAGSTTPDPYAIGPDRHERVGDETPEPRTAAPAPMPVGGALPGPRQPEQQPQPEPEQVEQAERITDKGLPKRTPGSSSPPRHPPPSARAAWTRRRCAAGSAASTRVRRTAAGTSRRRSPRSPPLSHSREPLDQVDTPHVPIRRMRRGTQSRRHAVDCAQHIRAEHRGP